MFLIQAQVAAQLIMWLAKEMAVQVILTLKSKALKSSHGREPGCPSFGPASHLNCVRLPLTNGKYCTYGALRAVSIEM